jgi:hypothetical protein
MINAKMQHAMAMIRIRNGGSMVALAWAVRRPTVDPKTQMQMMESAWT